MNAVMRCWQLPPGCDPVAFASWAWDADVIGKALGTPGLVVEIEPPQAGLPDCIVAWASGPLAGHGIFLARLRDAGSEVRTLLSGPVDLAASAILWRLWRHIPSARAWDEAQPDKGLFADSFVEGGKLADQLFPYRQ